MKKVFIANLILLFSIGLYGQDGYKYTADLVQIKDDKIAVELIPPKIRNKEITFYFPKMIPGTYAIEDYGRMVSEFKALDKKGRTLAVEKIGQNAWKIKRANKIKRISYWVEDTYDTEIEGPDIFQPAGTNIEENKNFILNNAGFFGYFEGMKDVPFELNFIRPENFYGATGLIPRRTGTPGDARSQGDLNKPAVDQFVVEDYDKLVDSPIMYSIPDTAMVKVGNTDVLIASYSPTKKVTAREIAESIKEVLMAQREYLGGELPVDKYAFIFYFTGKPVLSYGALEHSYSSFYYMPEMAIQPMKQQLRDFAAHEFFHIVTPLTIHSDEIGNFDFNDPKMSKHLWMYEGVTEYFASNMQVKYGLITPEQYLMVLREKMITADRFIDTVAFTDISKYNLEKYSDQYYNVYQKGALIGMALDIQLRELSGEKSGLQNLMADLSKKYGKKKAFNDDELFTVIEELTYPAIGEFLKTYVGGPKPLPYKELFNKVGIAFTPQKMVATLSLGLQQDNITFGTYDGRQYLAIANDDKLNAMGDSLGFKNGDILLSINDEELPPLGPELGVFIGDIQQNLQEGGALSYTVLRKNEEGKEAKTVLRSKIFKIKQPQLFVLEFDANATEEQLALRKSWLEKD